MAILTRIVVVVFLLAGASNSVLAEKEPAPEPGEVPKAEKACFRVRNLRGMDAVDDRFVYVRCVQDKHYLLTMDNACLGLQNSIAVAVANGYDRVCSNDHAFITYREFDQTRRCGILNVEQVADRKAALKLVELRKKPAAVEGEDKKTAASENSDGRR